MSSGNNDHHIISPQHFTSKWNGASSRGIGFLEWKQQQEYELQKSIRKNLAQQNAQRQVVHQLSKPIPKTGRAAFTKEALRESYDNTSSSSSQHEARYNKPRVTTVTIDSSDRDMELYPNPNHYKIQLNKELYNIKSIRLKSTEIPNTAQVISTKNNHIYWVDQDDIDQDLSCLIYDAVLDPGNYTAITLAKHMQERMNNVRRFSDDTPHEFIVNIDIDTDIASFQSISSTVLENNPIRLNAGSRLVTITHPNHTFRVGNNVVIVGALAVGAVTAESLNTTHEIISVTNDTYDILLGSVSPETVDGGGASVKAGIEKPFAFLFSNTDTPYIPLGFPQQNSSELLSWPITYIDTSPPDLDVAYTIPRISHPSGTYPAWFLSPGHDLQPGDRIYIRGTDTIPSTTDNVFVVTNVPDGTTDPDDVDYFEIGTTAASGTIVKVVNGQTIFTNTILGQAIESFDLTHRYITNITTATDHYFQAASPHGLLNFSNVYIAYTSLQPDANGPHGVDNIIFNPPDDTKFTIDIDITSNLSNTTNQEFVEIATDASYAISQIKRAHNGTLVLNTTAFAGLQTDYDVLTPTYQIYIGMPDDPLKTQWAVPDMNGYNVGAHDLVCTNFPGIVSGVIQQFQSASTIETGTFITDIIASPAADREVILLKNGTSVLDIESITTANNGYITNYNGVLSTSVSGWNAAGSNIVFIANVSSYVTPTANGIWIDAVDSNTPTYLIGGITSTTTTNPCVVAIAGHPFVGGEVVSITSDTDIPTNNYIVGVVTPGVDFEINYDNTSGTNLGPYGSAYGISNFEITSYSGISTVAPVGPYATPRSGFAISLETANRYVNAVYASNNGLVRLQNHTQQPTYRILFDKSTYSTETVISNVVPAVAGPGPTNITTSTPHNVSIGDSVTFTGTGSIDVTTTVVSHVSPTEFVVASGTSGIWSGVGTLIRSLSGGSVNEVETLYQNVTADSFDFTVPISQTRSYAVTNLMPTASLPEVLVNVPAPGLDIYVGQSITIRDVPTQPNDNPTPNGSYTVVSVASSLPVRQTSFRISVPETTMSGNIVGTAVGLINPTKTRIIMSQEQFISSNTYVRIVGNSLAGLNAIHDVLASPSGSNFEFEIDYDWALVLGSFAGGIVSFTLHNTIAAGNIETRGRYARSHNIGTAIPTGLNGIDNGQYGNIGWVMDYTPGGTNYTRIILTPIPDNIVGIATIQRVHVRDLYNTGGASDLYTATANTILRTTNDGLHQIGLSNVKQTTITNTSATNPVQVTISAAMYNILIVGQPVRVANNTEITSGVYYVQGLLGGNTISLNFNNSGGAGSPLASEGTIHTGHIDLLLNAGGAFTPRREALTPGDPIARFIVMDSSVSAWSIPTSVTPASGNILRINNHGLGELGTSTLSNTIVVTNIDSTSSVNNAPIPFDPTSPFTIRAPADIEVLDTSMIRFVNVPNVIPAFDGGVVYRAGTNAAGTTPEANSSLGDGYLRFARIVGSSFYPISNYSISTTGIIKTTTPHAISFAGDNVYIEGPDCDTSPARGIQGLLNADYISPTEFEVNLTDPGNPDLEITNVVTQIGRVVVVNPIQGTTVPTILSAKRASSGEITTSLDISLATPPSGGVGYPSSFDTYIANAIVETTPSLPSPSGITGGSLRNLTFRSWRYGSTLNGTSDYIFEPNLLIINTSISNPVQITTISNHGFTGGETIYIDQGSDITTGSYTISNVISSRIFEIAYDNTLGLNTTPYGLISPNPSPLTHEPFIISSVPNPPTFPTTVQWANAYITKQPILITDVIPSLNGLLTLDNAVGVVPNDNVYIEGTDTVPDVNGINAILNVYGSDIELRDVDITSVAVKKSADIGISYENTVTGNIIFDVSGTPATTFLIGEPVTISGHSVASYNQSGLIVENTTPGETIEVSGLGFVSNGVGGTVTADTYGRLIRTPSAAVADITDMTEGASPTIFTAPLHGFSTGILYFFNTVTDPSLFDAPDYGIRNDVTIIDGDTFSIPEPLEVLNRQVVLSNPNAKFTKQAIRTQTGPIVTLERDVPNNRMIITTDERTNPNRVSYPISQSLDGQPAVIYAPGHTFSDGDSVEIVNHKSLPSITGPYVISNVVVGVSFEIESVNLILGSPTASGFAVGPAEPYIGHGLRSLSGSFSSVPFDIAYVYHTNPARVVMVESRTVICGERLIFSGNAALPPEPYVIPTPITFGVNEFAVTRIFELDVSSSYGREFLINYDATLENDIANISSVGNPSTITIQPPDVVSGASIEIRNDTNIPDGTYVVSSIGSVNISSTSLTNPIEITTSASHEFLEGQYVSISGDADITDGSYLVGVVSGVTSFFISYDNTTGTGVGGGVISKPNYITLPYDNSTGTNISPYGYVYHASRRYRISNVSISNPVIITIQSHSHLALSSVVISSDSNISNGTYDVLSLVGMHEIVVDVETTTNVSPYGVVDDLYTTGGTVSRHPIQVSQPVIITSEDHGLYTGYEISITNADAVPTIDGRHIITRIDEHTFTISNHSQANTVAGETGDWTWGNQVVLHDVTTVPDITDIIFDVDVISDTQFAIPYLVEDVIDVKRTAYWGTNVLTVQYQNHGLASGDVIHIYLVEDVGGVLGVTVNTVYGDKKTNVKTITEALTEKVVTLLDVTDTRVGSPTFGQVIPNPDEFQIFASGYWLGFRDVTSRPVLASGTTNTLNKSPNRLLDAFAKSTVIGGGYNTCIAFYSHNTLDIVVNNLRNYGFRSIQSNVLCSGILNRVISLEGDNYIYLTNELLETVATTGEVDHIFAKILLSDPPGSLLFNTFLSNAKYFDVTPLPKLAELEFRFVDRNGDLFNFNGVDHSISLEVEEYVDYLSDTQLSDRRGIDDRQTTRSFGQSFVQPLQRGIPKTTSGVVSRFLN